MIIYLQKLNNSVIFRINFLFKIRKVLLLFFMINFYKKVIIISFNHFSKVKIFQMIDHLKIKLNSKII